MNHNIPNTDANTASILVPRGFVKAAPKYTATNDFLLISREVVRKSGDIHLPDAAPIVRNEGKIISIGPLTKGGFKEGQIVTFIGQTEHLVDLQENECICAIREGNVSAIKE